VVAKQFGVYLVALDPVVGSEISKTRPCAVVSPDEMNLGLATVIVAPMTTHGKAYPSRVPCHFGGKNGYVALDQLRTVDKARLVRCVGSLDHKTSRDVLNALVRMFSPWRAPCRE
jgi:mRNA interferase MazF